MPQYIYSMLRVSKIVPPKRTILKNISLSFFPGAKIGVLGLNGSGKSSLLNIMAGIDQDIEGEAKALSDIKIGYLSQEPALDNSQTVRQAVEEGLEEISPSVFAEVMAASTGTDTTGVILNVKDYGTINASEVPTFRSNKARIDTYKN